MTSNDCKKTQILYGLAYLVNVGLALFFAKGVKTLHPSHFLVLALVAVGWGLVGLFLILFRGKNPSGFFIYQIIKEPLGLQCPVMCLT